jgi:redox-sensitive bicupin YhaK (pirin superfamily)
VLVAGGLHGAAQVFGGARRYDAVERRAQHALGARGEREQQRERQEVQMGAREVARVVRGQETSDGAGVRLRRTIGTQTLGELDPFLLLDEFRSDRPDDYVAGFPDHPHRGFETVTYMLAGAMRHQDDQGNTGHLRAGSVQWMTAGRGIIHSEMPEQVDGLMWGFQLWVNLPARDKMCPPRYQDIPAEAVPEVAVPGARVRLVAGELAGGRGPVQGIATSPCYFDVRLQGEAALPVTAGHHAFVYVYDGRVSVGERAVERGSLAVLGDGDEVRLRGEGACLLVAGRPLGEPVARYGPFVMNTRDELLQAIADLRAGTLTRR